MPFNGVETKENATEDWYTGYRNADGTITPTGTTTPQKVFMNGFWKGAGIVAGTTALLLVIRHFTKAKK